MYIRRFYSCPRLLNRISKLSERRYNRCSRRPENRSQDQLKRIPDEKLIEDTEELQIDEEETELLKSGGEETMNSGMELSSLMMTKMRNEKRDDQGIETKIENVSKKNSQQINLYKKNGDIFSEDIDSKQEKLSKKSEPRVSIKVDNYTSVTSTLSNLSKTSDETSQTISGDEKKMID